MAQGFFPAKYGAAYKAVLQTIAGGLVFEEPALSEKTADGRSTFTGNLDLAANSMNTLAKILSVSKLAYVGDVSEVGDQLSISLRLADATQATQGLADQVGLLKSTLVRVDVTAATKVSRNADMPLADDFVLLANLALGKAKASLSCNVPIFPINLGLRGLCDAAITFDDLTSLLGQSSSWFPSDTVAPMCGSQPELSLLVLGLYFTDTSLDCWHLSMDTIEIALGVGPITLIPDRLNMAPLSIGVTVGVPDESSRFVTLGGTLLLCDHATPGDFSNPALAMSLSVAVPGLAIAGEIDNPEHTSLADVVRNLISPDQAVDIGLPSSLALTHARFDAAFDQDSKRVKTFSVSLGMSGGFGGLLDLELDQIELAMTYTA